MSLMGKSVIMLGRGCFLEFLNINTGQTDYMTINSHRVNGDGVKCFKGHPFLYIFAYCENCQNPDIYIKTYPDFQLIGKFNGQKEGYTCLTFSESSLLFSLGEMPNYKITAFNWRSMDKFAESANELLHEHQVLSCSYGRPMFLAQFGVGSTKLFIWDVFTVCKTAIFAKHKVKLGDLEPASFQDVVWSMESVTLYIIDSKGCIYTVDRDFYLELLVDTSKSNITGSITTSICWFQHGLTVSGPNKEIRHYKKVGATWICDSNFPTKKGIFHILSGKFEKCVGCTEESEIVSFGTKDDSFTFIRQNESNFIDICVLNPTADHMVVLRSGHIIDLRKIETGEIVSSETFEEYVYCIEENQLFPFIGIGLGGGILKLVSFYDYTKPSTLITMHLADFDIIDIRFFEQGNIFVAGNASLGEFFILKGLPGTEIEVLIHLNLEQQIVDYTLVASQNMFRFFALPISSNKFHAGNQIIRYCVVDNSVVNIKTFKFENDNMLYRKIMPQRGKDRDRKFYLMPFQHRFIEIAETKRGTSTITVIDSIKTGHQIRKYSNKFLQREAVTWSYDGFIFIRSLDFQSVEGMALSHHRYLQGVKTALINHSANIIVSLGVDGVLAAVRIPGKPDNDELTHKLNEQIRSVKMALMFKRPTLGFTVDERDAGKSWKEIQRLKSAKIEQEQCRIEKDKILNEFQEIQSILHELVDDNYLVPENKKLDLLEFYLDVYTYQKKQQKNKEQCKQIETYLKCLIVAQDKVSDYIIKNYYEPMGVKWQNIMGIFSAVRATNYCLLPPDLSKMNRLRWIEEQRKVERYLSSQDTFEPWKLLPKEKIEEDISRRPVAPKDDYTGLAAVLNLQEDVDITDNESYLDTKIALAGCVSQLYIDISPGHYLQMQLTTFYQSNLQQAVAETEVAKLKQNYNKCFLNTRAIKDREIYNIREKNARLQYIISEFNYFSDKKVHIDISDPEWHPIEQVETAILRVTDNEVSVLPYVSPSEQAILDAKAAEAERLRLLLLADDFRDKALMAMMNGVLEIRWEDELRKEVPKPKCMSEKIPEEYIEEDLRAIRDYDEKVAQLKTEREKYKSLLEVEFSKLSVTLRESIRKFNLKLYDCTKYKFYIDSGMNQENLAVNRQRVIQNRRIEIDEKEKDILQNLKEYEVTVEVNQKTITSIQEALLECRNNMETMQTKEKQFEKLYRKDFQDMSPVVQEQAYKLYKKRPKVNFRVITTATLLNELARGVMTNEITYAMTQECLEYMKALEQLDIFVGLPLTIDENTWSLICKHRRIRIEYEIRFRAAQIQILEGEATISTFQKRIVTQKEKIAMLNSELEKNRADRLHLIHNKPVQLVLRRGLVEIPLTGDLFSDFNDAILVPKSEIEHVNGLIVNAGKLKLKTIQQNMKFRRTMMATEWEHTKLRMKINDLIEENKDIENVKFTKEMQSYLKNKSLGRKQGVESYEVEIELLVAAYENRIKDKKDKVLKIQRQLRNFRTSNKHLDKVIKDVNIDVCHYKLEKDIDVEVKEKEILQARMSGMLRRNQLLQKIQENHNEILVLQAELELLRLRTFPTFKYKILNA